jgi:hypothetical protein
MDDASQRQPGYGKPPNRAEQIQREQIAWDLRCKGRTLQFVADQIGLTREGARRLLLRVEAREAKWLSHRVHHVKARQNGQLEHIIEEEFNAWHKSKEPHSKVTEKRTPEGETHRVTEVIEGIGDGRHLRTVMEAQSAQRDLLGMNVLAAPHPSTSVSEVTLSLAERARKYTSDRAAGEDTACPTDPTDPEAAPAD